MFDELSYQEFDDTFRARAQMFVDELAIGIDASGGVDIMPPALPECRFQSAGGALIGEADLLIAPGFAVTVQAELAGGDGHAACVADATARVITAAGRQRDALAKRIGAVANRVAVIAGRAQDEGIDFAIVDVRLSPVWLEDGDPIFEVRVVVDETGPMLRPWRMAYDVASVAEVNAAVASAKEMIRLRNDRLRAVRWSGGVGYVDAVTLRAIDATPEGRALLRQAARRD